MVWHYTYQDGPSGQLPQPEEADLSPLANQLPDEVH